MEVFNLFIKVVFWVIENLFWLIIFIYIIAAILRPIKKYIQRPPAQRQKILKTYIYNLVLEAEKKLGSKTGQAKLALVVKTFYSKCPADLRRFIPESCVLEWIEDCVQDMKYSLEQDPELKDRLLNDTIQKSEIENLISKYESEKEKKI